MLCYRRHVARPKVTRKVPHRAVVASSSLEQSLRRARRVGHPDDPDRAARRLRRGVERVWRGISERLSRDGRGPGQRQIRTQSIISTIIFNVLTRPRHWQASPAELHGALDRTREAYVHFRSIPAPRRGEIIRQIREALAAKVRCCAVHYSDPHALLCKR